MNYYIILKSLGLICLAVSICMTPAILTSLIFRDGQVMHMLLAAAIGLLSGILLYLLGRRHKQNIYTREALVIVGVGWLMATLLSALPLYLTDTVTTYVDAFFEAASGLTTTGASILPNIEDRPAGALFWRAFTNWLGGLGIVVLFISILPSLGSSKKLYKLETTGPVREGIAPKIRETTDFIWKIYLVFTVLLTLLLWVGGMTLFDALCHTFATVATGGFSTKNLSIATYNNAFIDYILCLFMFLSAVNFTLYYRFFQGERKIFWHDTELLCFLGILAISSVVFTIVLRMENYYPTITQAFRYSLFQIVSIITSTGFGTADFCKWPPSLQLWLLFLMFSGGCAGSTAGGIKLIRLIVLWKIVVWETEHRFHPRAVRKVKVGGVPLDMEVQRGILVFFVAYLLVAAGGIILLALLEPSLKSDIVTIASAVIASMGNIGPGLGKIGPLDNCAFFTSSSKVLLGLLMILGRLELFTILVLFMPKFWSKR